MSKRRKEIGVLGEKIAVDFLRKSGYQILYKNFVCKLGEIDIVAKDKDVIVFVEVKMRCNSSYGSPIESILWRKRRKLVMLAKSFIKRFGLEEKIFRFDVISIVKTGGSIHIELIKDAFWEV